MGNVDANVVRDFGLEWQRFDQSATPPEELERNFEAHFSLFPWNRLPEYSCGFDLGCGTGRWAQFVAPRVGQLHCIDPSEAIDVAKAKLADQHNCVFHQADVDHLPFEDASMDFGYAIGVLHHVPDTAEGIKACASKLKPHAPLLLYLYYAFDNRPRWYRWLWSISNLLRRGISRLPHPVKRVTCDLIAGCVYFPLARGAWLAEKCGIPISHWPLAEGYRNAAFYTMRTDALDRFGTRLEQRFTKTQIRDMMLAAGLVDVQFREDLPYWCAIGYKGDGRPA